MNAIDHFNDEQHQEFLEELSYEFSISLDKRVDAVQSEIIERISQKKNWVAIEDIMKIHPKSTLQEIGDKIGITRERVRQIKVNICSLKCELAKDYRIEQFLCWSCFESNQPLIFIDELDNRLIGLLQDIKSQLIIHRKTASNSFYYS
ncbi:sigma factor-like helix-turn-helix DNA-binding protein [Lactiplantibacillus plantarum]|uniref:sigma factor-like helix-turn-helix DNA-binding protein n=1 Tax=Lactiplantibacillus plantarum TaxID=1590 RepID=UPI0012BA9CEE|nr:sigma factor-like helix-turn-helix DNA-binding protein [Lactiplantibacillus plantarum]